MKIEHSTFDALREKYFEKRKLLGEIMYLCFINNDTFPDNDYVYFYNHYSNEDIKLIFSELNLPVYDILLGHSGNTIVLMKKRETTKKP